MTVTDDETAGVTVSPASLTVGEGGSRYVHRRAGHAAHPATSPSTIVAPRTTPDVTA